MYRHILFPTDGSILSAKAMQHTLRFAKSVGARVTAVNVVPEYQSIMDEGFAAPVAGTLKKRYDEAMSRQSQKILDEFRMAAGTAGVACDASAVISGTPYDAIIKQARKAKCDLIMMASHGRKGLSSILLGSETVKVLTHSNIPVLVVR